MKKMLMFFLLSILLVTSSESMTAASSKKVNLVAFGDSITHGTGDPSKKGYMERVKDKWEEKKGISIQLSNFGIPKYTTEDVLAQLKHHKVRNEVKRANYIILYIGTNDFRKSANYDFEHVNERGINEGKLKFSANLQNILAQIRNENKYAPIFVLGLYHPYVESKENRKMLGLIEHWNNEIVRVIGEKNQTHFVPTIDLFKNKPKQQFFSDSLHPNPAGYHLIADRLSKKLILTDEKRDK